MDKFEQAKSGMSLKAAQEIVDAYQAAMRVLMMQGPQLAEEALRGARARALMAGDTDAAALFYDAIPIATALAIVALVDNGAMERKTALNQAQQEALSEARALVDLCHYAESMIADAAKDNDTQSAMIEFHKALSRGEFDAAGNQRPIGFTAQWND